MPEQITPEIKELEVTREDKWTNVQVDSSFLSLFMSCARKYDYVANRHLVPITGVRKSFQKGSLSHLGLHAYWQARIEGKDYQEASIIGLRKAKEEAPKFENLDTEDCLQVYQTLVDFFKFISNSPWIPVFAEQYFKKVAYEDPELRLRIVLTGRIDLGVKTAQMPLLPIDNKTESERWFYSQMSNQFKIYCIVCGVQLIGVQRFGFQKTLKPEEKFKLELIPFDADVLEEFRTQILPYWTKQLLICHEDNYWPPNTSSCISGHFKCEFSDAYNGGICNVSREVREQKLSSWFTIGEEWDPEDY